LALPVSAALGGLFAATASADSLRLGFLYDNDIQGNHGYVLIPNATPPGTNNQADQFYTSSYGASLLYSFQPPGSRMSQNFYSYFSIGRRSIKGLYQNSTNDRKEFTTLGNVSFYDLTEARNSIRSATFTSLKFGGKYSVSYDYELLSGGGASFSLIPDVGISYAYVSDTYDLGSYDTYRVHQYNIGTTILLMYRTAIEMQDGSRLVFRGSVGSFGVLGVNYGTRKWILKTDKKKVYYSDGNQGARKDGILNFAGVAMHLNEVRYELNDSFAISVASPNSSHNAGIVDIGISLTY
jgi:hypothetical protein